MIGTTMRSAVCFFSVLALASCAQQGEIRTVQQTQKEIVLIAKSEGEFWNSVKMGAEAAASEFGVKLTFDAPASETDVQGQIDRINKYLAYGADGLIIAANDYERLAPSVDKADSLGVPVVAIESEIHSAKVRSFVGIDNYQAGRQAARKMKELAGGKGSFIIVTSVKGTRNTEQRDLGILDEWGRDPGMKVVKTAYCSQGPQRCSDMIGELLTALPGVNGILALNAEASTGAAEQIRTRGLSGQIKLVGFDNSPEELEWLQEGVIQATVIQNPFSIGYLGVKAAADSLAGQSVNKRIDTGTRAIDAESMFWSDNQKMLFPFVQ